MTKLALALSIAALLLGAMGLGWALRWVVDRAQRSETALERRLNDISARLSKSETAREAAERRVSSLESAAAERTGEDARAAAAALAEMRAERDAAMETVGELRRQMSRG